MLVSASNPFKWRHYQGELILLCVRWYLRYPLSYAHVAEMMAERNLPIDRSCIWRWVQAYGPELDKRCRPYLKATNDSWRVDETYIKVKGRERFLYRAVDSSGQLIDFLLTDRRDTEAAKRFFRKALHGQGNSMPRVINVDHNGAFPAAFTILKSDGTLRGGCHLRRCKYLNNIVEQDHRNVKRRTWLACGYKSFRTAWRTLRGIEAMAMIRKGRAEQRARNDVVGQVKFISDLFRIAA